MVNLVILNITSWAGQCSDAEHIYGTLILCDKDDITIENVTDWNVRHLGKNIELRQPVTLEMATKFDKKDGGNTYKRSYKLRKEFENDPDFEEFYNTNRFETFEELENFAIAKWRELNIECPFISLYDGETYDSNYGGEVKKTKILYK